MSAIVMLVERTTRYALLRHLSDSLRDSATVRDAVIAAITGLPPSLRRTLISGPGGEMARHTEVRRPSSNQIKGEDVRVWQHDLLHRNDKADRRRTRRSWSQLHRTADLDEPAGPGARFRWHRDAGHHRGGHEGRP